MILESLDVNPTAFEARTGWVIYIRQAWNLEAGDPLTGSRSFEGNWLDDVKAIGAENYYPPIMIRANRSFRPSTHRGTRH